MTIKFNFIEFLIALLISTLTICMYSPITFNYSLTISTYLPITFNYSLTISTYFPITFDYYSYNKY